MSANVLIASLSFPPIAVMFHLFSFFKLHVHAGNCCMMYIHCCRRKIWPTCLLDTSFEFRWNSNGSLLLYRQDYNPFHCQTFEKMAQTIALYQYLGNLDVNRNYNKNARIWCVKCGAALYLHCELEYHEKPRFEWRTTRKLSKYSVNVSILIVYNIIFR